jgi:hypothetical protein
MVTGTLTGCKRNLVERQIDVPCRAPAASDFRLILRALAET